MYCIVNIGRCLEEEPLWLPMLAGVLQDATNSLAADVILVHFSPKE